jgi:F-type H+-transporting ATPase subunit c
MTRGFLTIALLACLALMTMGGTVLAQGSAAAITPAPENHEQAIERLQSEDFKFGNGLKAIAAGIVVIGAGVGIGMLAAAALSGMARQPEMAGQIQTGMIIAAALIEGPTFFALIICFMA